MIFIQRKCLQTGLLETVDETETRQEAIYLLKEYRLSDRAGDYYMSQRACKEWREANKKGA